MKKYLFALIYLSLLGGCGKSTLPSSCADALHSYAKLSDAQKAQFGAAPGNMIYAMMLGGMLRSGGGEADKAVELWTKRYEAEYERTEKNSGAKSAQLGAEQTKETCDKALEGIRKIK